MFKGIIGNVKEKADAAVIEAAKAALIKAAVENKIDVTELITPKIDEKFTELAKTILEEHGYAKLVKLGLIAKFVK